VGEDINYLLIEDKKNREKYILAEDNHQNVLKYYPGEEEHNYQIVKKFKGKDLIGKKYKPLFKYLSDIVSNGIKPMVLKRIKNNKAIDLVPQTARRRGVYNDTEWKKLMKNFQESNDVIEMFKNNSYKIYSADFVNTDEGTGVVHIAPAFGEDDFNLSQKYNLPLVQHVLPDGRLNEDVVSFSYREGLSDNFIKLHEDFIESLKDKDLSNSLNKWVGLEVKPKDNPTVTDKKIVDYLEKKGLIFASEKYTHSYPHCWRCDSPLLNYTTSSWFVNVEKNKKKFLKTAKNINWMPDHVKEGRFGKWLEGARDWSISRQRYWGSVMPIWVCRKCGQKKVIGSIQELEKASDQKVEDLHKHHVDKIEIPCEKCEGKMKRIPDVLDCWFESGSMPYAQLHYPFENQDKFKKNFPAEFIAEGADQTRAWFYYLHVLATAIKKSEAFKNVVVNGIVLAEDGKKMSKKLSNYPDPMEMFNKYGADAMRFYLASAPVMKADDLNFSEKDVDTVYKKVLMMLGNVLSFYKMFEVQGLAADTSSKNILDRWIITKIEILKYEITKAYEGYDLVKATRPLAEFINELSTWYLRRSRSRFKSDSQQKKAEALKTLKYVLQNLALIMSPVMPFTADYLYQESGGKLESVHLEKWPEVNQKFFQEEQIIKDMESARNIVELALAKRDEAGVKVRQPLSQIIISSEPLADELVELIKDEVNIKEVVFKPAGILSVKLDTNITAELKEEGLYRELVRTINQLRKEAELTIKDIVAISFQTDSNTVKTVINNFKNELLKNTISSDIAEEKPEGCLIYKDVKVNEEEVWLGLK